MQIVEGTADVDDVQGFVERLDAIGDRCGVTVQAFDARYLAGHDHLEAAVERANRAIARDDAIADDRGIEILLYAAGRRQIDRALEMGVHEGSGPVAIVIEAAGEEEEGDEAGAAAAARDLLEPEDVLGARRDEALLREFFSITDEEVGATDASLEELVIERVALLVVEK